MIYANFEMHILMAVRRSVIRISQLDMKGRANFPAPVDCSDACIPFNSTQHIWRVIDDFDLIPRVPFTATTFFNGGAGDEGHLLMTKSIVKVDP